MSKRFYFIIISLIVFNLKAQYFTIEHPDCRVRIKQFNKDNDFLKDIFFEKLKERNFKPDYLVENKRLIIGEMYLTLSISTPKEVQRKQKVDGKLVNKTINPLYPPCVISLELKKAKGNIVRKSDKTLFTKTIERGFPRITFKGNERCTRALKEAFVHIPKCKSN